MPPRLIGEKMRDTHIDIVFDGPPGPVSGRFVEVENSERASIRLGEWLERDDGYWVLRFDPVAWLREQGAIEWYCEAWEQRRGVSEPCESGSTHDAPDFNCHWRIAALRVEGEEE